MNDIINIKKSIIRFYTDKQEEISRFNGEYYSFDDLFVMPELISNKYMEGRDLPSFFYENSFMIRRAEPVELRVILSSQRSIVSGGEGSGKSTLARYISNVWATGGFISSMFDLVFYIPVCRLNNQSLSNFIKDTYGLDAKLDVTKDLSDHNVLFIIDDFDMLKGDNELSNFIQSTENTVLITSRSSNINNSRFNSYEINGFSYAGRIQYITRLFSLFEKGELVHSFETFLNEYRGDLSMINNPLILDLTSTLWLDEASRDILPQSINVAGIFKRIVVFLMQKSLQSDTASIDTFKRNKEILRTCGMLAFESLIAEENHFFSEELADRVLKDTGSSIKELVECGLLSPIDGKNCSFTNKLFEKFFIAHFIVNFYTGNDFVDFVNKYKFVVKYRMVMVFIAGFLDERMISLFFDTLLGEPKDIAGFYQSHLAASCLIESGYHPKVMKKIRIVKEFKLWSSSVLSKRISTLTEKCFNILSSAGTAYDDCLKGRVIAEDNDNSFSGHTSKLEKNKLNEAIVSLIEGLKDSDPMIREVSAEGLGHLVFEKPDQQVSAGLIAGLMDKDVSVRVASAEALGKISWSDDAILISLLRALKDTDESVVMVAVLALGQIGNPDKRVLGELMKILSTGSVMLAQYAAEALGYIGFAHKRIIMELLSALKSEHVDLRLTSAEALGNIGKKHDVIIKALESLLDDEPMIKTAAAIALGKLGATNNVVYVERVAKVFSTSLSLAVLETVSLSSILNAFLSSSNKDLVQMIFFKAMVDFQPISLSPDRQIQIGSVLENNLNDITVSQYNLLENSLDDFKTSFLVDISNDEGLN